MAAAAVPVPESFAHHFFIRFEFAVRLWINNRLSSRYLRPLACASNASCFCSLRRCSHCQASGGDQANAIYLELERMGFQVT